MEKFEKGKWYKSEGLTDDIMEFDKIIGDKFYYTRRVKDKLFFPNSDWSNIHWYKDYKVSEVPLSEIQQYLPKEELTSLPEKWWIQRDVNNYIIINAWFFKNGYGRPSASNTPINYHSAATTSYSTEKNGTEITFDQFKKWVLKENQEYVKIDFKSKTKEQEQAELLIEAIRKYPVGTKYKTVCKNHIYVVDSNHEFKFGWNNGDNIYLKGSPHVNNFIYKDGKWADIIEIVKSIKDVKVDDYIYILQQCSFTDKVFRVESLSNSIDGSICKANGCLWYDKQFRYATGLEIHDHETILKHEKSGTVPRKSAILEEKPYKDYSMNNVNLGKIIVYGTGGEVDWKNPYQIGVDPFDFKVSQVKLPELQHQLPMKIKSKRKSKLKIVNQTIINN